MEDEVETTPNDASTSTTEPTTPKEKPWFQKRIDEVTAEKWDARRAADAAEKRARELEAELARVRSGQQPSGEDTQQASTEDRKDGKRYVAEDEVERLVEQRAREKAEADAFTETCNKVFEQGKKEFSDFEEALTNFQHVGGMNVNFVEAAIETGHAHLLLHHLGQNPDEAYRIIKLSPIKMATELTRLAAKLTTPKADPVSGAPEPIKPPRGGRSKLEETDPDKMTTKEWMAWREKQLKEKGR